MGLYLTVDVEDWHQLLLRRIRGYLPPSTLNVVDGTTRILDLLDETGSKATFFVVGAVARTFPGLIRRIVEAGHMVGSHGHTHTLLSTLGPRRMEEELSTSKKAIEDACGQKVEAFRAPEFSLPTPLKPFFEGLAKCGYSLDSSLYPTSWRALPENLPPGPFKVSTPYGEVREAPITTFQIGSLRFPVGGGTAFRFIPSALPLLLARDPNKTVVLYVHPYECLGRPLRLTGLLLWEVLHKDNLKYTILHNFRTRGVLSTVRKVLKKVPSKALWDLKWDEAAPLRLDLL